VITEARFPSDRLHTHNSQRSNGLQDPHELALEKVMSKMKNRGYRL
jgi:hypothetical protein